MKELSEKQENLIILGIILLVFVVHFLALTGIFGPEIQAAAFEFWAWSFFDKFYG